jgi:ribosomal protein L11 methyltransferase
MAVRVAPADADRVLVELLELVPAGLEEATLPDGRIEYALYGAPGELPALPEVHAAAGGTIVEVLTSEISDDWSESWRDFHQPVDVAERLRIRPPWSPPTRDGGRIDIVIDPGQAFGTGGHPTTRLCLELLLGAAPAGSLLDVGCGSGVLAIAAAKLGFAPVYAIDNDRLSVDATLANAAANCVSLDVRRSDLRREALPAADTVTANLLAPLLVVLGDRLAAPPRRLIAGGLLVDQVDEAVAAFDAAAGLRERHRRSSGEWAAVELVDEL